MAPPRRKPVVSSAGGRLVDPPGSSPGGPPRPPGIQTPGTMANGSPVGAPQGDQQGIRGMANEQYRNALLRRAQGGASVGAPQQPADAPPGPLRLDGVPGGGPSQMGGGGNPADLLKNLLRTRTSRRVLGGGGT